MLFHVLSSLAGFLSLTSAMALEHGSRVAKLSERTTVVEARDSAPDVIINLTSEFNAPSVLSYIDSNIPSKARRTSAIELSWQSWGSVPGPVKPRATRTHKDTDPVIRIAIALKVNTPAGCSTVDAHIVFYLFIDNSAFNLNAVIDAWDTLTSNTDICQGQVNDALRAFMPSHLQPVQDLVNARLATLPNEHFPSFRLLPAGGGAGTVQLVLERSTIVSRWSDLCMDVRDASQAAGALLQQWNCVDSDVQRWDRLATTDGYFLLRNRNSGLFLAVQGSSGADGAAIGQWERVAADPAFEWRSVDPGGNSVGAKWLINRRSGKCVADTDWSTALGTILTQETCVGGWKHYWYGV